MIPSGVRIFVCTQPVDMRYGFDRLAQVARERVGQDPIEAGALFVFAGKSATRLKVLWFDRNGPLPNDSGAVRPATVPRPRRPDRGRHDFEPVNTAAFPRTRRLCFTLAPAEAARRGPPRSFRPQTVLRDSPTTAPAVLDDDSCHGAGSRSAP